MKFNSIVLSILLGALGGEFQKVAAPLPTQKSVDVLNESQLVEKLPGRIEDNCRKMLRLQLAVAEESRNLKKAIEENPENVLTDKQKLQLRRLAQQQKASWLIVPVHGSI